MKLVERYAGHEVYLDGQRLLAFPSGAQVACYQSPDGMDDVKRAIDNGDCDHS